MRTLFTLFGGMALPGAAMDGALAALLGLFFLTGDADPGAAVAPTPTDPWPAVRAFSAAAGRRSLEPAAVAISALAVFIYLPVRIILGVLTGAAAFAAARRAPRS